MATTGRHESKTKFLEAALQVIRTQGYAATTVDDICEAAGMTKGSFFHHFKSKEDLALAAADHFAATADELFEKAPYRAALDPRERLLGYVDFRISIIRGELAAFTCLLGTMAQEVYQTHPAIRAACDKHISAHAARLAMDIAEARRSQMPEATWTAESLALFMQAVIQGAFVIAKAKHGPEVAVQSLEHLRRYLELLFPRPREREARAAGQVTGKNRT